MSAPERPTVLVTALPEEMAPILRRLSATDETDDGHRIYRANVKDRPLVLAVTGDGARNAERRVAWLCARYRPTALVAVGIAGSLSPSLGPLDLAVSARLRNGSGGAPPPDPGMLAQATAAGARPATFVTVSSPVVSAAGRKSLAETLGGEIGAVDMESAGWARAAAAARVPFVVVRAISDGAEEELPEFLAQCVGEDGGIARGAVVRRALLAPASIPALWRMRGRLGQCAEKLSGFLADGFLRS